MLGVLLGLSAAAGFGTTPVFARLGLQYMRPTTGTLVSVMVGTAIAMAMAFALHWEVIFSLSGVAFLWFLLSGTVNFPIGRLLSFTSVRLVGVSRSTPIVGSFPLFATVLAITIGGETISIPILLGTISIMGGLTLILTQR